jgi:hypothetical protein
MGTVTSTDGDAAASRMQCMRCGRAPHDALADCAVYRGADYGPHHEPWQVQCDHCRDTAPHYWHWFAGCTCAAGGCHTEHSDHCNFDSRIYGQVPATLVYDDALLMPDDRF